MKWRRGQTVAVWYPLFLNLNLKRRLVVAGGPEFSGVVSRDNFLIFLWFFMDTWTHWTQTAHTEWTVCVQCPPRMLQSPKWWWFALHKLENCAEAWVNKPISCAQQLVILQQPGGGCHPPLNGCWGGINKKRKTLIHHAEAYSSLIFNSMHITAKVVCHVANNKDKGSRF